MRIMTTIAAVGQAGLATLFGSGIAHAEPGFEPLGSYGKRDRAPTVLGSELPPLRPGHVGPADYPGRTSQERGGLP
jgi:hypothetical protein